MLMMRSVTQPSRCCQGIQWGMARMSIVASTGSPSTPRSINVRQARTEWSNLMFWLTASVKGSER